MSDESTTRTTQSEFRTVAGLISLAIVVLFAYVIWTTSENAAIASGVVAGGGIAFLFVMWMQRRNHD